MAHLPDILCMSRLCVALSHCLCSPTFNFLGRNVISYISRVQSRSRIPLSLSAGFSASQHHLFLGSNLSSTELELPQSCLASLAPIWHPSTNIYLSQSGSLQSSVLAYLHHQDFLRMSTLLRRNANLTTRSINFALQVSWERWHLEDSRCYSLGHTRSI